MGTYENPQDRDCQWNPFRRHTEDDGSDGTLLPHSDLRPRHHKSSAPKHFDLCHLWEGERESQRKFDRNDMVNEAETIEDIQEELDEVVDILRDSLDRILEEDAGKIEDLDHAAENIREEAKEFKHISKKVIARSHWRRNRYRYEGLAVLLMLGTLIAGARFFCRRARM